MVDTKPLKTQWFNTSQKWGADLATATHWIDELFACYQHKNRHYHDLTHIVQILTITDTCREHIQCPDSMFFATWFHDAVQKMGVDSEGKSAELAQQALAELAVPQDIIDRTVQLILATKTHDANVANPDVGYFIDCDLSILGANWPDYEKYADGCSKEYKVPRFLYRRGRKKFMTQFLQKPQLFQTEYFRAKLESIARQNIQREIDSL